MKPLVLLPLILLTSLLISENPKKNTTGISDFPISSKKIIFDCNSMQSKYGPWQKVSCYKGLQTRTVRGSEESDGTYWWSVQFRNLYTSEVRFSYNIVEPENESKVRKEQIVLGNWRLGAGADPEKEGYDSPHAGNYVKSAERVFVYITNVRLALNGNLDVPPIRCDY